MKISEIVSLLNATMVCGRELGEREVEYGFASDLMSDVLTLETDNLLLITGLANNQAVRTAEMSDIPCIIFVRNKKVTQEMIELAVESNITLIEYSSSMFKAIAILSQAGIKPVF
ncbi:MAG TPA: hypothetical protein DCR43_01980 [Bacteroidales bacterium]|nr:MAG: hypothetical protein A2X11_06710 [Bacteroidetes bacterium GWE2_42_24]OFY25698.1 MAG: hypothetical protein A2X09_01935 [Bacteroidetes bacterium GWF2_43_11]PKP16554.1 MAG: hypothetical protein CVU06_14465 [Bacteroidetes bacterium HGW-Bacteroidetes-22]HAQ64618.1 hypothetical protein [Bacteroidales bacterium]HBZ68040.1 hypothetical protein [Bacteroidales bacterium]